METRKPLQGVINIIRFNWHFYAASLGTCAALYFVASYLNTAVQFYAYAACILALMTILLSLLASFYIYDLSSLYQFDWLKLPHSSSTIVNINAGFDETSALVKAKFPNAQLITLDFYDPTKHTEISIERARKAYPPFPGTRQVPTSDIQILPKSTDIVLVLLAAHEIRNSAERILFFKELAKILKPNGTIFLMEHLRDFPNFLVFNIGAFHFHSRASWRSDLKNAGLSVEKETKITPFVSLFQIKRLLSL